MKTILYSKSVEARTDFVVSAFSDLATNRLVYLCPKKFMTDIAGRIPYATIIAYEDVTKSNELFNVAGDDALLVFDRAARYKNITSSTFVRLSRAAAKYRHKIMVDIVPFTTGIEYLYSPLAFIDRQILGYQHWYSFRENNMELDSSGAAVRAHDLSLLAKKIAPVSSIDYSSFTSSIVQTIDSPLTSGEAGQYKALRDELFAVNTSASPIITKLADWTNVCESRYERLEQLLNLPGKTVVYTNLAGHNKRLQKRFPGIDARSFYDTNGEEAEFDRVILFEAPIVKGYLFHDVIANVRQECEVLIFKSNTTVDKLLFNRLMDELRSINEFTAILSREVSYGGK